MEVSVFLFERHDMRVSGDPIDEEEFDDLFRENFISVEEAEALSLNEDFDIVITTKEDRIENIWIELEYSVFELFQKKVVSQELIV